MKNEYFQVNDISVKAKALYQELARYRTRRVTQFVPQKSALLVLDMQAYFLLETSHAYIPSAPAIIPRLIALIQEYRKNNLPVFFTRHLNTPDDAAMMASWWHDMITSGHPLSKIIPELDRYADQVIHKSQYDAFFNTSLAGLLQHKGVSQVVICGVMTHLCCETSARSAFVHGFEVYFPIDGTATYNEDHHRATLLNLSHGFATLMLMDDLITRLEKLHEM